MIELFFIMLILVHLFAGSILIAIDYRFIMKDLTFKYLGLNILDALYQKQRLLPNGMFARSLSSDLLLLCFLLRYALLLNWLTLRQVTKRALVKHIFF